MKGLSVPMLAFATILFSMSSTVSYASTFEIHCRDRSPELIPTRLACIGPVADIVERALMKMGHKVKWLHKTWDESIVMAETGDVDMLVRHSMSSERKLFLDEVAYGYEIREVYYYVSPFFTGDILTQDELNPLTVGALEGSFYSAEFADNTKIKKVEFASTSLLVEALEKGTVDAVVTSSAHEMDRINIVPLARRATYIENFYNGRFLSIPKNSNKTKYFKEFEKAILEMAASGEVTQIFTRYGLDAPSQLK